MSGTQTTVLVSGEPKKKEANLSGTVKTSDTLEYVAGSVGTVGQVSAGGAPGVFMLAKETFELEYGGSYTGSDRVQYYVPKSGDEFMAKVGGSNTTVSPGDRLGFPAAGEPAGALTPSGNGYHAVAKGSLDAAGTGVVASAIVKVEAI